MNVEQRRNDTDRGKPKLSDDNSRGFDLGANPGLALGIRIVYKCLLPLPLHNCEKTALIIYHVKVVSAMNATEQLNMFHVIFLLLGCSFFVN
jgi:hypothetical protein